MSICLADRRKHRPFRTKKTVEKKILTTPEVHVFFPRTCSCPFLILDPSGGGDQGTTVDHFSHPQTPYGLLFSRSQTESYTKWDNIGCRVPPRPDMWRGGIRHAFSPWYVGVKINRIEKKMKIKGNTRGKYRSEDGIKGNKLRWNLFSGLSTLHVARSLHVTNVTSQRCDMTSRMFFQDVMWPDATYYFRYIISITGRDASSPRRHINISYIVSGDV